MREFQIWLVWGITGLFGVGSINNLLKGVEPDVGVRYGRPPHYVNEPVKVEVQVKGWEADAVPTGKIADQLPDDLQVDFQQAAPQHQEFVEFTNGQLRRTSSTTWIVIFQVVSRRAGKQVIGPLEITQGTSTVKTEPFELDFQDVPPDPGMSVELVLPDRSLYVGERVTADLIWRYQGSLEQLADLVLQLNPPSGVEMRPMTGTASEFLPLQLGQGATIKLPAERTSTTTGGERTLEFRGKLELAIQQAGTWELPAPIAQATRIVSGRRDPFSAFFGDSVRTARGRAEGTPLRRTVKSLPLANRPTSFAGAVGQDYDMNVVLARSVVHVGDPLAVEITLRGPSLATLRLPDFTQATELPADRFQVPSTDIPGDVDLDAGTKSFRLTIRVKDVAIQEFPALSYSWFDPVAEQYVTAKSEPIALRVLPSDKITADAVQTNRPPAASQTAVAPPATSPTTGSTETADATTLRSTDTPATAMVRSRWQGADLSYVDDRQQWVVGSGLLGGMGPALCYGGGGLLLAWGCVKRWRGNARRDASHPLANPSAICRTLEQAASMEPLAAARHLMATLQPYRTHVQNAAHDEWSRLFAELERIAYNPRTTSFADVVGETPRIDSRLIERACQIIRDSVKE